MVENIAKEKEERTNKIQENKKVRKELSKQFRKRTKKGQPIMGDIANRLLAKLQKEVEQNK